MGKRYYGLDIAKGVSVLGMVLSHSFMETAARWNKDVLFSLVAKIPIVLLVLLMAPIVLFAQMGSMFSLIAAACVTISFLHVSRKGFGVVWRYIFMKIVFAFILRGIEIFWNQWTVDWDFFETGKMQWPIVDIPFESHTLDCIGFIGWFIPLLLYGIRLIPYLKDYRIQAGILYVLSLIITMNSRDISAWGRTVESYCRSNGLSLTAYLFSKVGNGPFQIPQVLPFGLMGCAIGVLFHSTNSFRPHWWFLLISSIGNFIFGIYKLTFVDDFLTELFSNFKPEGFMLIMMSVQYLFILICCNLLDNPSRPITKRFAAMKHTTFLRRVNTLSLSAFVFSSVMSKKIFTVFQLPFLFGQAIDFEKKQCIWDWPVVALYSFSTVFIAIGIARVWEIIEFRFSVEQQLAFIMQWLFNRSYNKIDYKKNIYGPLHELQEEMAESMRGVVVEGEGEGEEQGEGGEGEMEEMSPTKKESPASIF